MAAESDTVRSLLMPITWGSLLLPSAAVAEVVAYHHHTPLDEGPPWLMGRFSWRGLTLPLVSLEAVMGTARPPLLPGPRVAILNAVTASPTLPFYALNIQGIPHLVQAGHGTVVAAETDRRRPGVALYVQVMGQSAVIPDLEGLQRMVRDEVPGLPWPALVGEEPASPLAGTA
jgi:chemosensory pili system protein ChpC